MLVAKLAFPNISFAAGRRDASGGPSAGFVDLIRN